MANVMTLKGVKNHPSRSGHDLSARRSMSAKASEIHVAYVQDCLPGDSWPLEVSWFTRTQPLNKPSYVRLREYIDFYFVPYNQLWNKWEAWVYQQGDENPHAEGINRYSQLTDEHPYFTSLQIINYLKAVRASNYAQNIFGFDRAEQTCKLLHELRYGDFYDFESETPRMSIVNRALSPWKMLAYQKVYADHIRDSHWEKMNNSSFNLDYMTGSSGTNAIPVSSITLGQEGLPSPRYENMFDMRYSNWSKDYFMGLLPEAQFGAAASVDLSSIIDNQGSVYLNAIGVETLGSSDSDVISPANQSKLKTSDGRNIQLQLTQSNISYIAEKMGLSAVNLQSAFTVLALRKAEASQKYKEVTNANDKDIPSQANAHWNVTLSDAMSSRCKHLGGVTNNIDISEVVNHNITGDNAADMAGKGAAAGSGRINFSTDVHGVLIGIYRCVPILDYAIDGVHRSNLKTKLTDYAIPEFDRIGMDSMNLIELTSAYEMQDNNPSSRILGYAPRYYEYKTNYDDVCGAFYNGGDDLESWLAPLNKEYIDLYLHRVGWESLFKLNFQFFKINPAILNPIFTLAARDKSDTDQFFMTIFVEAKPVRKLDYDGLPY